MKALAKAWKEATRAPAPALDVVDQRQVDADVQQAPVGVNGRVFGQRQLVAAVGGADHVCRDDAKPIRHA